MKEEKIDSFVEKIEPYLIIVVIASFVGVLCGVLGFLIVYVLDRVVSLHTFCKYLVFLMPFVGLLVVFLNKKNNITFTDNLYEIVTKKDKGKFFSIVMFVNTCLSQVVGASVGRLEFPIRIAKRLGVFVCDVFSQTKNNRNTVIASAIAGLLSATFGAPLTSSVIACELFQRKLKNKNLFYFPVLLSALFSRFISFAFGTNSFLDRLIYINHASVKINDILSLIALVVVCLVFAILFNKFFNFIFSMFSKISNEYIRMFIGSVIVVFPIYFLGTLFYGNNPDLIKSVISSHGMLYAFVAKAILTCICLSIGFKGGRIAPSFVVGVCLGILIANLTGINLMIGAAVGGISMFCVVTNLYVSSVVLGIEVFGIVCSPIYALVVLVLYFLRSEGYFSSEFSGGVK